MPIPGPERPVAPRSRLDPCLPTAYPLCVAQSGLCALGYAEHFGLEAVPLDRPLDWVGFALVLGLANPERLDPPRPGVPCFERFFGQHNAVRIVKMHEVGKLPPNLGKHGYLLLLAIVPIDHGGRFDSDA